MCGNQTWDQGQGGTHPVPARIPSSLTSTRFPREGNWWSTKLNAHSQPPRFIDLVHALVCMQCRASATLAQTAEAEANENTTVFGRGHVLYMYQRRDTRAWPHCGKMGTIQLRKSKTVDLFLDSSRLQILTAGAVNNGSGLHSSPTRNCPDQVASATPQNEQSVPG